MRKSHIKILSLLAIILLFFNLTGCKKTEAKPILKVVTTSSVGGISSLSNTNFYVIYDNNKKEKTKKFDYTFSLSNIYCFSNDSNNILGIDLDDDKEKQVNDIAQNIYSIISNDDNIFDPDTLYLIEERYYFTAKITTLTKSERVCLCEYNLSNDTIREIATFNENISYVCAY